MTFGDKLAIRILLLVARMVVSEEWRQDIKDTATHISVHAKEVAA